jgi:hypothetical protein
MVQQLGMSRRGFATAVGVTGALAVLGCSEGAQSRTSRGEGVPPLAAADLKQMIVYRDPSCPCCEKWAAMAGDAGFKVQVIDRPDMPAIKARYGVPEELASCHTTMVGGYAFEGHVPFAHLARVLKERPADVLGLAVAGMPAGSPGMEVPGGVTQDFHVMAFAKDGKSWRYDA